MKQLLLLFFIIFGALTSLQAQVVEWAQNIPQCSTEVKIVENGNNVVLATLFGKPNYSQNLQISSYNKSGKINWTRDFGSPDSSRISLQGIGTDGNQNIYFSGYTYMPVVLGTYTLTRGGFIVKLDAAGNVQWVNSLSIYTIARDLAVDKAGNIFISGDFSNSITLGSTTLTTSGQFDTDAFFAKINTSGTYEWVKQIGTPQSYDGIYELKTTPTGEVILFGGAGKSAQIGTHIMLQGGGFLAKYKSDGNILWVKEFKRVSPWKMELDTKQNIILTGHFSYSSDTLTIEQTTITAVKGRNQFITKLDPNGNLLWLKKVLKNDLPPNQTGPYDFVDIYDLKIDKTDNIFIAGGANINVVIDNVNVPVKQGKENSYIVKYDQAGVASWGHSFYSDYDNTTAALLIDSNQNMFVAGTYNQQIQLGPYALTQNSGFTWWACGNGYFAKLSTDVNAVSGQVFLDANQNGIKDSTEESISEVMVTVSPGPVYQTATINGDYNVFVPAGNFNISLPNPPKYYIANPVGHSINQANTGITLTGKDFALTPRGDIQDITVSATNLTPARPGFGLTYQLMLHNSGTAALADTVAFTYDNSRLNFDSASVPALSHQNGKLRWKYQLQPNKKLPVKVYFTVKTNATLGDTLVANAAAGPFATDVYLADNQEVIKQIITGSYDPNDKQVRQRSVSPAQLQAGEYLDYTIRFQNTGTDTAFTVVVQDTLSQKLDLSSLEMLSFSHPYKLEVTGNKLLSWRFSNILLPDSNTNEPASHGFIRFRIKAKQNLKIGERIENKAYIYFDFNEAIITNTAETVVEQPWVEVNRQMVIYPNPTRNQATLQAKLNIPAGEQEVQVRLISLIGQQVWSAKVKSGPFLKLTLNLQHLKGFYLVQVIAGKEVLTEKLLVE